MVNVDVLDDIAQRLGNFISPEKLQLPRSELHAMLKQILQSSFRSLNLVTREEFEVQCGVLQRTREKLETLERILQDVSETARFDSSQDHKT